MIDPISDMFNRIRNAQAVQHLTVDIPLSKEKYKIAEILEKEKLIEKVEKIKGKINTKSKKNFFRITLKYEDKMPAISMIKRISKSGQRIYVKAKYIKFVRGGYGISIISTPK